MWNHHKYALLPLHICVLVCIYVYIDIHIYIDSGSLDPNMWIPRWIYLYTYIYRWIYLYTYIYILSLSPFMARSRYEAVRITMEICRCPPFSAPWIGNRRKDPGEPRCDMEGPKKLIGQPWKMVVEWKFNQQKFGFHGISPTIGISWNLSSKHWRSNGISPKKNGIEWDLTNKIWIQLGLGIRMWV